MRIFVYEWTCCNPTAPPSLRREGSAMRQALLADFQSAGIETVTMNHGPTEEAQFRELAATSDLTLVIAPETNNILLNHARWVRGAGGRNLGSTLDAIALTSDKRQCAEWWRQHGVPTPALREWREELRYPIVLKPRDGAGSLATFLVHDADNLAALLREYGSEKESFILQDFVPGQSASVSFLLGPHCRIALPPATQSLSDDGRFRYLGGKVPLTPPLAARAIALGRRAIDCIPGLAGYIGVDQVLGDAPDGSADFAIEINPRLTTSYIGLRQLCRDNLALAMIRVANGERVEELKWRDGEVHF